MVISFANNKGGVGKTTLAYNTGGILASLGYKVLMIDMDGQCSLTSIYKLNKAPKTIYDTLVNREPLVYYEVTENLYCCPSNINMSALDADMASRPGREYYLRRALSDNNVFDFVLCDCPPNIGISTMNALTASDYCVIALESRYLSATNLSVIIDLISDIRGIVNGGLKIAGIAMTRFKGQERAAKKIRDEVCNNIEIPMFRTMIRENSAVGEAPMFGMDILRYQKGSIGAMDHLNFTKELIETIGYGKERH